MRFDLNRVLVLLVSGLAFVSSAVCQGEAERRAAKLGIGMVDTGVDDGDG